ncbi:hypothetical protein F5876DRAFT_68785 [Lentinula aff. lateritia]|uniref:Uncharacterized protein n=1 Tax=Lentinula aff. lateritia TaxID=2804960 RepID=A0ACC1TPW9_9AGAR|nr:hypothetical protein F5876DRAFT_68785 [Lentinula aff. lateritia]
MYSNLCSIPLRASLTIFLCFAQIGWTPVEATPVDLSDIVVLPHTQTLSPTPTYLFEARLNTPAPAPAPKTPSAMITYPTTGKPPRRPLTNDVVNFYIRKLLNEFSVVHLDAVPPTSQTNLNAIWIKYSDKWGGRPKYQGDDYMGYMLKFTGRPDKGRGALSYNGTMNDGKGIVVTEMKLGKLINRHIKSTPAALGAINHEGTRGSSSRDPDKDVSALAGSRDPIRG